MNKIVKGFMFLSMGTFLFSQNILTNPSFEDSLTSWNIWPTDKTNRSIESTGNNVHESTATVTARSGSKMLKTWGQYDGGNDNETPSYYEGETKAGTSYNFSIYAYTHPDDAIRDGGKAYIKIKFFDSNWAELAGASSDTVSGADSTWRHLSAQAVAPEGAAMVQAAIIYFQKGWSGGSVYWDDAYFTTNSFTKLASVKSSSLWKDSGADVRGIAAGSDLDGDGKQEIWATHYNVPGFKNGLGGSGVYGFEYVGTDSLVQIFDGTIPFTPHNMLNYAGNEGFELGDYTTWNIYPTDLTNRSLEKTGNNVYGGVNGTDTVTARTGTYMLKTWGQNNGSDNTTPSYYEGDTSPGTSYTFGGYGNTFSPDSLKDGSQAWLQIKFFDGSWGELAGGTSDTMSATSEPNKWHFLRTEATAPAGAVKVQAVIVHSQKGYSGGSVYWDDMNLSMAGGPRADYGTGTRHVNTGDLDGDGKGEVIFFKGRYNHTDESAGLYVYEYDGSDNGFSTKWHVNLNTNFADTLTEVRVESFAVADVDKDGQDELIIAVNGPSNPPFGSTVDTSVYKPYSGDRFIIASVQGDIGVLPKLVEEFSVSPRDGNKDGVRENMFGGGSPQGVAIADTDGDKNLEIACFSWNNLALFFIESDGPNSYVVSDTANYYKFASIDDWTLSPTALDMDGDGKDEIYSTGYGSKKLFVYADTDGDALVMSKDEAAVVAEGPRHGATGVNSVKDHGAGYFNMSPYGGIPTLFVGGNAGSELIKITLKDGASVLGGVSSWDKVVYDTGGDGGFVAKPIAGVDFDRDGKGEVVLGYQANPDSGQYIQIMEYSESSVKLSVDRELTIITPEDYKLSQNYPNPFNPTTTIQYTLPMRDQITVTVYNMLGQEVVRLMNNESKPAGTYQISWNGMDKNGVQVSSGMYFYTMSSPHMQKTMRMTFLK